MLVHRLSIFSGLSGVAESPPSLEALWVRRFGPFQIQGGEVVALQTDETAIATPTVKTPEIVELLAGVAGDAAVAPTSYSLQVPAIGVLQLQEQTYVPTEIG